MADKQENAAMIRAALLLWVSHILLASAAWSADDPPLRQAVAAAFPHHKIIESTGEGDLDGDGRPEVAVSMEVPGGNNEVLVAVFKRDGAQSLRLWTATRPFKNCQHGTEISLSKASLSLSCFHSGDGTMLNNFDERFKWRAGALRLVGSDERHDSETLEQASSRNLLTGEIVERERKPGGAWREERRRDPALKAGAVPLSEWGGWF
jgi:hypothetical protein